MKINLNVLSLEEAIVHVRKWQKNRYKNGLNSYSNDDPYVHETNMMKKFIVSLPLALIIIDYLIAKQDKYSCYAQHFTL